MILDLFHKDIEFNKSTIYPAAKSLREMGFIIRPTLVEDLSWILAM
jgi:hypothetical protein